MRRKTGLRKKNDIFFKLQKAFKHKAFQEIEPLKRKGFPLSGNKIARESYGLEDLTLRRCFMRMFKKLLNPMRWENWANIREGMLIRIFYILMIIGGAFLVLWFLFFFLVGESMLYFFKEILINEEYSKTKLQFLILLSGLPLFLLLWGFRTEDTNTKLLFEALSLLGSQEARRQALIKLLFLKKDKKVFIDKINNIIKGANFSSKKEDVLDLSNMDLKNVNFMLVDFSGSNLARSNLKGVNLEDSNLQGTNLKLTKLEDANLERARLKGADLKGANLVGANLAWADLKEASLINIQLRKASLQNANLSGANLEEADLLGANLEFAKLKGVNLSGANLQGANLTDAKLENANLTKAHYNEHTKGLTMEQKKVMNRV